MHGARRTVSTELGGKEKRMVVSVDKGFNGRMLKEFSFSIYSHNRKVRSPSKNEENSEVRDVKKAQKFLSSH